MLEANYAQAITELLAQPKADASAVAEGLQRTLLARGHLALLPRIMAHLERTAGRERNRRRVVARIAGSHDAQAAQAKAKELAAGNDAEVIEDESLITGFAIEGPGFRYDASSRAALMDLYRTLSK